jgi:hypothetical protein
MLRFATTLSKASPLSRFGETPLSQLQADCQTLWLKVMDNTATPAEVRSHQALHREIVARKHESTLATRH